MDYIKPVDVALCMIETGRRKLALSSRDLLLRGALAGGILGIATSLAFTAAVSTGQSLVGALIFPVGLVMIVLLGLELSRVTWSHSVRPIGLSVALRLLAAPIIGLLLAGLFGFQGAARQGAVTETAMPAAVTNTILATEYGLDPSLVTAMIFVGTLLSPLTLTPLLVYLGR